MEKPLIEEIIISPEELTEIEPSKVRIVRDYKELHFDDVPILYAGKNEDNEIILGSHLEEDDENEIIYTLHTILTKETLNDFVSRKITYLKILESSDSIHLVEKRFSDSEIQKAYKISFDSINPDYLPLKDSYCPVQ
jgi:hypothetical protein